MFDSLGRGWGFFKIKNNLLLVGVGYVGVSLITGFIGGAAIILTVLAAVGIAIGLGSLGSAALIAGIVAGVALVALVSGIVQVFSSYIGTAYHTCLFIWARDAERAQAAGQPVQAVQAPAPLAAVLGR